MYSSDSHANLNEIATLFEALAAKIGHAIEMFTHDDSGTVNLAELHRAKEVAQRGAKIIQNARSEIRRAFD